MCEFSLTIEKPYLLITYKGTVNFNQTLVTVEVNQTIPANVTNERGWKIRTTSTQIVIQGNPEECGRDGFYHISLITPQKQYNSSVEIDSKKIIFKKHFLIFI